MRKRGKHLQKEVPYKALSHDDSHTFYICVGEYGKNSIECNALM